MGKAIDDVRSLFQFNNVVFLEKVGDLEDAIASRRPMKEVNPIIWMVGHMTTTRNQALGLVGKPVQLSWASAFDKPYDPTAAYPSMSEVKTAWSEVSNRLHKALDKVDSDKLDKKIKLGAPVAREAVRGGVIFFLYHEAWHLGQVSYAMRGLGMDGLIHR